MSDLVGFLKARRDDEEGKAGVLVQYQGWAPSQLLRHVEATRRLIQRYERAVAAGESVSGYIRGQDRGYREACLDAIRDAAEVHANHPDYDPAWRT